MALSIEAFVDSWINHKSTYLYPSFYADILPLVEKLKKLPDIDRNEKQKTPDGLADLVKHFLDYKGYINRFCDYNQEFTPTVIPNRDRCIQELKTLSNCVSSFGFSDAYDYIVFKDEIQMYNPFTDAKFNFGLFRIKMYAGSVIVEPAGNNTKRNGYYHPYVKNHKLCLGEYKFPYKLFYNNMMYYDAWLEAKKCLTVYGGDQLNGTKDGPEQTLNVWIGYQCDVCKQSVQPEDIVTCVKSRSFICRDCVNTGTCIDETTGEYYLPQFVSNCASCGKNASTVINGRCLSCRLG